MFRFAMSLMTAATVLWHAVVGCCVHHDHSEQVVPPKAVTKSAEAKSCASAQGCCCKYRKKAAVEKNAVQLPSNQTGAHEQTPAKHSPYTPCEGEKCSFAVVKIVTASDFSIVLAGGYSVTSSDAIIAVSTSILRDLAAEINERPPTLRAHLALQVLLI